MNSKYGRLSCKSVGLTSTCMCAFMPMLTLQALYCITCIIRTYTQSFTTWDRRGGRDPMVVGFTTTCAVRTYHH